jgi:hypothetical protein
VSAGPRGAWRRGTVRRADAAPLATLTGRYADGLAMTCHAGDHRRHTRNRRLSRHRPNPLAGTPHLAHDMHQFRSIPGASRSRSTSWGLDWCRSSFLPETVLRQSCHRSAGYSNRKSTPTQCAQRVGGCNQRPSLAYRYSPKLYRRILTILPAETRSSPARETQLFTQSCKRKWKAACELGRMYPV